MCVCVCLFVGKPLGFNYNQRLFLIRKVYGSDWAGIDEIHEIVLLVLDSPSIKLSLMAGVMV